MISQLTQTSPWLWRTTLYAALAMGAYALLTDQVVQAIVPRYNDALLGGYNITRGPSYLGYILMLCAMGAAVLSHIYVRRRKAKGLLRDQLSVIGSGFLLTLFVGLVLAAIIPSVTGSTEASEYSFLAGLISVGSFTFAIVRHGLFDVKLAAIRTAGYALTLATLSLVYFMLAYLASVTIFKENLATGFSMSPVNIGLALVLAFIFQPIKRFFDKTTDRIFYRDKYDTDEFIARLSEVLTTTTDLRNLLQRAAVEIGSTLKSEQAFFYVEYAETKHVSAGTTRHSTLSTDGFIELKKLIQSDSTDIFVTSLYNHTDPIYRLLTDKSIAILMPLRRGRTIMGYLALGEQRGSGYNNRDIKVLSTISDELLIAIQNSLSAQEVREINTHLQERIKAATEELQRSNDQLKKLDKSKDEFISMASHQLRTPLTAVKGYISMILDGDIGDISKEQRQVLEQAFDSSQRMVFLIGDFLNVSRIQTGKFMLELTEVNLTAMLPEEIEQLIDTAKRRKLNIHYEMSQALPAIIADENKLRQVMMNFMDNAIYYSKEGTTIQVRLYKDGNDIVFKVIDTGIGVPKAEQPHLFTKFYRASNARQRRPDGTGIGLYMAKKVIVAHGGAIIFETKESVGSTFGFRLPLKNKLEKLK
jgi:signal transduction histidine kinase